MKRSSSLMKERILGSLTKKVAIAQMDVNPAIWQEVANVLNLREA